MAIYTQVADRPQDSDCAVDIETFGNEICDAQEVRDFLAAIPEPASVTEARYKIITAFESGAIGAVEALNALDAHGCLEDANDFMLTFVVGYYARLGVPSSPPPETPPAAPAAAKGVRVTSKAADLAHALAPTRAGRPA